MTKDNCYMCIHNTEPDLWILFWNSSHVRALKKQKLMCHSTVLKELDQLECTKNGHLYRIRQNFRSLAPLNAEGYACMFNYDCIKLAKGSFNKFHMK